MSNPNRVVRTNREVIESKLLNALQDEDSVAILASSRDLDVLIAGLSKTEQVDEERAKYLLAGMKQLRREAFGL